MHAATYKIIDELCLVSSDQKELFIQQGFVPVFAEILKKSSLCRFCLKKRHALDEILNIAIAVFPFFFNNFSYIAASLLESEECYFNKVIIIFNQCYLHYYYFFLGNRVTNTFSVISFPNEMVKSTGESVCFTTATRDPSGQFFNCFPSRNNSWVVFNL